MNTSESVNRTGLFDGSFPQSSILICHIIIVAPIQRQLAAMVTLSSYICGSDLVDTGNRDSGVHDSRSMARHRIKTREIPQQPFVISWTVRRAYCLILRAMELAKSVSMSSYICDRDHNYSIT